MFGFKMLSMGLMLGLMACSHTPTIKDYEATANPTEEIQKLDSDMTAADRAQVEILSPANYENARVALKDAKHDLDHQKDNAKVLHEVAVGRAYLKQAQDVAQVAHANMDDVIQARQQAIDAGAPKHFGKEFATVDRDLREITKEVEKGDTSDVAKYRPKLQGDYLAVELSSIKVSNLEESKNIIQQAEKQDAKTYAPQTLAIARKSYQDTDAFINANRHDPQVATKSAATLESAKHLLKITQAAKGDKKTSPEELALQMEKQQNAVAQTKGELATKETELQGKDAQLSGAALALQESNRKAQTEKDLQQKYETARAQFSESEAEVYKQGDALVIRLKALDFPKAQAVLKANNFALLAKVQKVLKDFDGSAVTVEGHTDSIGGKAANEKLSTARAEAIREYFIQNSAAQPDKITAVGYDFQKPLASNKTAAGRAQNRRVDIRIQPEKSTSL